MKYKFLLALLFITGVAANGQQLQTSSLYDLQGVLHNPSTAGVNGSMIGASYRTQWSGISGSPKTITVFGAADIQKYRMGIGGYVYRDKTGPTSRTGLSLSLAKHIPTGNGSRFSLGIEVKGLQYSLDRDKLTESLGADPAIGASDNRFAFDAGFGLSYTAKKWQVGASVSQLVQSKLDFYSGNMAVSEKARLYRHYYFHGLYKWDVDGVNTIVPNVLVIYLPNSPTEYQFGARLEHKEMAWMGLGYRVNQSWMLSAGIHIKKKFSIGYSYDIYQTPLSIFDGGSNAHEFLLRYSFSK